MTNHPVAKHDQDRRDDRHDDRRDDRSDDRRDDRRKEDSLVMPLAEPGPGEPLVGATSVIGDHIEDGERDPHTIAEEQRIRSAAYEAGMVPPDAPEGETRRVAPPQPPRHTDNHSRR